MFLITFDNSHRPLPRRIRLIGVTGDRIVYTPYYADGEAVRIMDAPISSSWVWRGTAARMHDANSAYWRQADYIDPVRLRVRYMEHLRELGDLMTGVEFKQKQEGGK